MTPRSSIYPPATTNANWFSLFNAISFQITLGSPMILFAKSLGATTTVLGVIAAMTPLLMITQIPAARFLARTGYRTFILFGWGSRTFFIFFVAVIPLLGFLGAMGKVALLLFALFGFNLLRGVASGAWLPWLSELIPEEVRGRFFSRDQIFQHVGSLTALALSALIVGANPEPWRFSAIFLVSWVGGLISLLFLRLMPDGGAPEALVQSTTRVPWREIVTYPPFARLVIFNLLFAFAVGSLSVFTVAFLKSHAGFAEDRILAFVALSFAGAMASLPFTGRIIDRTGSKPMLRISLAGFAAIAAGWTAIAAECVAPSATLVASLHVLSGFALANFHLANLRIALGTMPPMGRTHFFAFFSVITSLGLGASPLLWGVLLDALAHVKIASGAWQWNAYSIFFAALLVLTIATMLYIEALLERHGSEPKT